MDVHNVCPFCNEEDNVDHLLVTCSLSKRMCNFFLPTFKRIWSRPNKVKEALSSNHRVAFSKGKMDPWAASKDNNVGTLCNESNRRIFSKIRLRKCTTLFVDVQDTLFYWSKGMWMSSLWDGRTRLLESI